MVSARVHTYAVAAAIILLSAAAFGTTWDASAGWSSTSNPSGPWSYGWTDTTGGAINLYVRDLAPPSGATKWSNYPDQWHGSITRYGDGRMSMWDSGYVNTTGTPPGIIHSTVLRWTSPVTGSVRVLARFEGSNGMWDRVPGADVAIYRNSSSIYSAFINTRFGLYPLDSTLTVSVGDTVDFVVRWNVSGGAQQNYVPVYAVITNDPDGSISGVVTAGTAGHPPISQADVTTPDGKYHTRTDSAGTYSLSVPPGTYSLTVTAPGYSSAQATGIAVSGGSVSRDFDLVGGTISGIVTARESSAPLAGALVRTDGDPYFSAVTGTDGAYSLAAQAGTYNVLATAPGRVPGRATVTVAAGSSSTAAFPLDQAGTGTILAMPAPLAGGQPPSAPAPPGDSYPIAFPDTFASPVSGAPIIAEFNETAKPDESFSMTGTGFTTRTGLDAGTDTIVWVWARTSADGGTLRQARIWRVTENVITATLPDDIPFGMYMVWVENANGASAPVCLNKTTAQWIGPLGNTVQAGNKKRVFGRNISYNHGTGATYVYIQPASGGSFISCPVTPGMINPYMVEFTVPSGTPNGSYKVFVHNGQGGVYGWSDGVDLIVQPDWARGTATRSLTPNSLDDTSYVQDAINYLTAQPNGGTLNLSAGNFVLKSALDMKSNVEIKGAGMNQTYLLLQFNGYAHTGIMLTGPHSAVTDLTIRDCAGFATPQYEDIAQMYLYESPDTKWTNMRVIADQGQIEGNGLNPGIRSEIKGCEFYRLLYTTGDCWAHDCNFYGNFYGYDGAGVYMQGWHDILENSHCETPNWPINPANGSRNYKDWMTDDQIGNLVWCSRAALTFTSYAYVGNVTGKDLAVEDNQGEILLYHGMPSFWYGNVLSTNGRTINLRTDGLVDGQPVYMENTGGGLAGGQTLPDAVPLYRQMDGNWALITNGKGVGQARQVVCHTPTSVTVDKPWTVQPDSTSKLMVVLFWAQNTAYNNNFQAFPPGYVQGLYTASRAVDIDGNGWHNTFEANVSYRTNLASDIHGHDGGPSYWNTLRDSTAVDCYSSGYQIYYWRPNPVCQTMLGNRILASTANVFGSVTASGANRAQGEASVIEKLTVSGKASIGMDGTYETGGYADGFAMYRGCSVTTVDPAQASMPPVPEPVYISSTNGRQFLVNNTYAGAAAQTYYMAYGIPGYSVPAPEYRVARFTGYAGHSVAPQIIPVANAGIAAMNWTVTPSDSWIGASVQANGTLAAESTLGRLVVSVDTSGMPVGKRWGYVTINTGTDSVRIGVSVDLSSGSPGTQSPVASISATPSAGIAPLSVSLDGSASYDPDGSIASYYWDFGDGAYGTGVAASHTYALANTYTPVLTVTDNSGAAASAWTNVIVAPPITSLTLSGNPTPLTDVGVPVTVTTASTGGYQVQYRFLYRDGTGWHPINSYSTAGSCIWTPSAAGYYELKAQSKSSVSTNLYDIESNVLSYPVGLLPTGMRLWLKPDAGITKDAGGLVSQWADQSGIGNSISQTNSASRPVYVDNVQNGHPVVRFQGPGQMLQSANQALSGNTSFTTFTVARLNSIPGSNYQYLWWNGADSINGGYGAYLYTTGSFKASWGSGAGGVADTSAAIVGTWYRVNSRFNYSTSLHDFWVNGNPIGTRGKGGSNLSGGGLSVGNFGPSAGYGLYGDLAEMIIYGRNLSDTEVAGVDSYMQSRWSTKAATPVDRLKDVKSLGDGVSVSLTSAKIAASASGTYADGGVYAVESDRTCGLKIVGAGTVSLWDNLTLTGTTDSDQATGERILRVSTVSRSAGTELAALGMSGKTFAATGQFVRLWGKVVGKTASVLTIDDGSGKTVAVQLDGLVAPIGALPNIGSYVSVAGPAGIGPGGATMVRPRSGGDIMSY